LRDGNNSFLSDDEYAQLMDGHIVPEATYQAARLADGVWGIPTVPLCLYHASFEEQPGASYKFCSGGGGINGGITIRLTAGSDTRAVIEVTGCALSLNDVVADIFVFIANHRSQEYAQSFPGGSVSPQTAREELLKQASVLRGIRTV
jgi:hypothetical protein